MHRAVCFSLIALSTLGCKALPEADPELSESLVTLVREFDADEELVAAELRAVERQMYIDLDLDDRDESKRAVSPDLLTPEDVAHLEPRPDSDLANNLAVATGGLSEFDLALHATIPPMEDQKPVEPQSPDHYNRTFLEGRDCWEDRGCEVLATFQDLTKSYSIAGSIEYEFYKDFRWIDMNAGTDDDDPRWAYIARSWNPEVYETGRNILHQSYTVELWIPRDGRGFTWAEHELAEGEEAGDIDSAGGGTLRMLALWNETDLGVSSSESIQVGTMRWGMNQNYKAVERYLEETFGEP